MRHDHDPEVRERAEKMVREGWSVPLVSAFLNVSRTAIRNWTGPGGAKRRRSEDELRRLRNYIAILENRFEEMGHDLTGIRITRRPPGTRPTHLRDAHPRAVA